MANDNFAREHDGQPVQRRVAHYSRWAQYSRWDGTQQGFDLDALDVLSSLSDDLAYHGDPMAGLRRLMQEGFDDVNGERIQGLREILERIAEQRQQLLDDHNLDGVYGEISDALDEVIDSEDRALQSEMGEASPASSRSDELAAKQMELGMLGDDLASKVKSLQNYDFESSDASEAFDKLLEKLRQEMVNQQFIDIEGAMADMSPDDLGQMSDMMASLNRMLENRAAGVEPETEQQNFELFMESFGEFFPSQPRSLDELLAEMAQRMADMASLMNSMSPEQRRELAELSEQLLSDLNLDFEASRLSQNLQEIFPQMGWEQSQNFEGGDPLGFAQGMQAMAALGQLDSLEQFLGAATSPAALAEVDLDRVAALLGDDVSASLEKASELADMMASAGLIQNRDGSMELTPKGLRKLGNQALKELFSNLDQSAIGGHNIEVSGFGHERNYETKPYEFGDPFNLHIGRTVSNAIRRSGGGTPVKLRPVDFEIERTERQVRSSTVLMLDLSLSMPMRGNFLPAKKVALALYSLISGQFPSDYLGLVSFSEVAKELAPAELPSVSWDFVYGTNMAHGFALSRKLLSRQSGTKQIIMITDGEPTAHLLPDGSAFFSYPPAHETIEQTMAEVMRCTKANITINTFMLDPDGGLRSFIERLSKLNGGRAFFTTPENLGDYVLVDFLQHKRSLLT